METARDNLSRLRGGLDESNGYFARELAELRNKMDANAEAHGGLDAIKSLMKMFIHHGPTRKGVLFVTLVQLFFIFSGGNSITYYAPTILQSIGLNSRQVLLFTAVYGCIKLVSVFIYAFALTDRFGRRTSPPSHRLHNKPHLSYLPRRIPGLDRHFCQRQPLPRCVGGYSRHMCVCGWLRFWLGSCILPHSLRNLSDKHPRHGSHNRLYLPESSQLWHYPWVSQYDAEYASLWTICTLRGIYLLWYSLGFLCFSGMQRAEYGEYS